MSSTETKPKSLASPRRVIGTDISGVPGYAGKSTTTRRKIKAVGISYHRNRGVDAYVRAVAGASPMETIAIERQGVLCAFIDDLSKQMGLPSLRMFDILGVPKAKVRKKGATEMYIDGCAGQSAVGIIKLLGIVRAIVNNSTAEEAKNFDSTQWFGQWIERPQPALGGRKPAELMDTPTGVKIVAKLLRSIESGAYQ